LRDLSLRPLTNGSGLGARPDTGGRFASSSPTTWGRRRRSVGHVRGCGRESGSWTGPRLSGAVSGGDITRRPLPL